MQNEGVFGLPNIKRNTH